MPETDIEHSARDPVESAGADVVVLGILSYNNAATIGNLIHRAQDGLATYFPKSRGILVHADGGSKDGTQAVAQQSAIESAELIQIAYPVNPVQKISPEYYGVPGKTNAMRAVFGIAIERNARVCVLVDSNVVSLMPAWIESMVRPVIDDGFDLVAPCYLRHKYDGTILNGIVYPLTRALYGRRIQQPMGGEFAYSAKLFNYLMQQPQWEGEMPGASADIWMTIQAVCGGFRVAQAFLGPRTLGSAEPAPEVSSILAQTLGSIFMEMNRTAPVWQRVRSSERIGGFGPCGQVDAAPAPADVEPIIQSFRLGYQSLQDIWRMVLPPASLMDLKRMSFQPAGAFLFDDALWARVVYDFALAWRMRIMDRDHLLRALTPLYLGWVASYILSVRDADSAGTQVRVEATCLAFEAQKSYLISRWRWPDRFNP